MTTKKKRKTSRTAIAKREPDITDPVLIEYAAQARSICKRVIGDVAALGVVLDKAKKRAGHGHWLPWLRMAGIGHDKAADVMRVSRMLRSPNFVKHRNMAMSFNVLRVLARPSVTDDEREAAFEQAKAGRRVNVTVTRSTTRIAVPFYRGKTTRIPLPSHSLPPPAGIWAKPTEKSTSRYVSRPSTPKSEASNVVPLQPRETTTSGPTIWDLAERLANRAMTAHEFREKFIDAINAASNDDLKHLARIMTEDATEDAAS